MLSPKCPQGPAKRGSASKLVLLGAAAASFLASCASGPSAAERRLVEIVDMTRASHYPEAAAASVELMDDLSADSPLRDEVRKVQREISLASGMALVRARVLGDRNDEALEILKELDKAHPESNLVDDWRNRVEKKIADEYFDEARYALGSGSFDDARAAYAKSVEYDPSRTVVQNLLVELDRVEAWRKEVAEGYYYKGVGNLVDGRFKESVGDFGKVKKYRENPERAARRITEVNRQLAQFRVESADQLVADGRFAAAAKEYVEAARLDPESEVIARNLEGLRAEAKAQQMLFEARSMILRGELDRGRAKLEEAKAITALQAETFDKEIAAIADRRVESSYQRALGLEHDFQFAKAVTAYQAILEGRDYYKDVRARIDTLTDKIANADRLYAEYQSAGTDAERLGLLRQIEIFWPDYKDIPARIRSLAKSAAK